MLLNNSSDDAGHQVRLKRRLVSGLHRAGHAPFDAGQHHSDHPHSQTLTRCSVILVLTGRLKKQDRCTSLQRVKCTIVTARAEHFSKHVSMHKPARQLIRLRSTILLYLH